MAHAARPDPCRESPGASKARVERESAVLDSLIQRLDALTAAYPAERELAGMSVKRIALRQEALSKAGKLRETAVALKSCRASYSFKDASSLISQVLDGGDVDVSNEVRGIVDLEKIGEDAERKASAVSAALEREQTSFESALSSRRLRSLRALLASLLGAGLASLAALLWFSRGRRARRAEIVFLPPPAPRALKTPKPFPALPGSPLSTGVILAGNYRILKTLQDGTLGSAYTATELDTNRIVIVKRLRDELHGAERDVENLLSKARLAATLKHPSIAEVHSVFIHKERIHLAIENVPDGVPQDRYFDAAKRRDLPLVKIVVRQLAAVLDFAHERGVVHGDLKPSNVLLTPDDVVKVCDFELGALARRIASRLSRPEVSRSTAYLAPEQELGSDVKESDLYSLGVLFYEMLTGRVPFEGPNALALKKVPTFVPPSQLILGAPSELDELVLGALQPEPELRFTSADAFARAVEALPEHPD